MSLFLILFQEVLPGKLLADQLYRCPDRYLFEEEMRHCQREHRVTCRKFTYNRRQYYKQGRDSLQKKDRINSTLGTCPSLPLKKATNLLLHWLG